MDYAFQSENKLFFALEYCPGGELFFYLSQIGRFKQDAARFYAANILLALEHLHSKNILYRDLKPENVLVGSDGYVRLTDFGLSKENINGTKDATSLCGTAEYLSPEILQRQGHGKSTDWWSFGAIIYEMLVGLPPFYNKDREKLYQNIKYQPPNLNFEFLTPAARDLCAKLLIKNPLERLGAGPTDAAEIKSHEWFDEIDWNKIENKLLAPPYKPQLDSMYDVKHFPPEFTNMAMSPTDMESLKAQSANNAFNAFSYDANHPNSLGQGQFQMN
jgi:serine/threonine protein kinase